VPLAHLATVLFVAVNLEVLQVFFEVKNTVGPLEVGLNWRKSFNLPVLLEILARFCHFWLRRVNIEARKASKAREEAQSTVK
jgi:hypothetical protein